MTTIEVPAILDWRSIFPVAYLNKDELLTIARLRKVAQEQLAPRALKHFQTGALPIESYKDLADAGLLALTVPLRHGGKEFSPLAFSAAMIELGQGECADVHLVVRDHGLYIPGLVAAQLTTFGAACTAATDPTGTGPVGPNECADVQFAAHVPFQLR